MDLWTSAQQLLHTWCSDHGKLDVNFIVIIGCIAVSLRTWPHSNVPCGVGSEGPNSIPHSLEGSESC